MTKAKRTSWTITPDKFLNEQEIEKLLKHLTERRDLALARGSNVQRIKDYYLIRSLLETGARLFELCALKESDFHGQKLIIRRGKGGKARTILLTRGTANLLREWISLKEKLGLSQDADSPLFPSRLAGHYSVRGVQYRIEQVFEEISLRHSAHHLRHSNCSLLMKGKRVGLPTIRDNMGHSSLTTTNLYAHALGSIEDVDLFDEATSPSIEKGEVRADRGGKKSKDLVKALLRKAK